MEKLINIFLLLGGVQGILLSILLFKEKSNHAANIFLSLACFSISIHLIYVYYWFSGLYLSYPQFLHIPFSFPFLYGPAFYLYTKVLTSGKNKIDEKLLLHFIPFVLALLYAVPVYLQGGTEKIELLGMILNDKPADLNLINDIKPVHATFYIFVMMNLLRKHKIKIKESYANIDKINLKWLSRYVSILFVAWLFMAADHLFGIFVDEAELFIYLIFITATVFIYLIGYWGLNQPEIFIQPLPERNSEETSINIKKVENAKYQKSGLTEEQAGQYLNQLVSLMEQEKPYLKNDLTINLLAETLKIKTHNLSEVINSQLNQNFYDFINSYRVKEVKDLIKKDSNSQFSILALGFDAGFSSKSAFYSAFKKETGMTPAQYRKSLSA